MSLDIAATPVEYPESDGQPMGETDLHRDWMIRVIDVLKNRYRDQQVYVTGDLLLYYEQGDARRHVAPDAFVVKDCHPRQREFYKLWEERHPPHVAFEITSRSTRREDTLFKPRTFALMGIQEYFAFDPTSDYLTPALQGFRLQQGEYVRIEPASDGSLACEQLDLLLRLDDRQLCMFDRTTGQLLHTETETERAAKEAERAAREAAEAEVCRLRKLLDEARRGKS